MDIKVKIGYGGVLGAYKPKSGRNKIFDYLWTYHVDNIDASATSAYFLFQGISNLSKRGELTSGDLMINLWGKIDSYYLKLAESLEIQHYVKIEGFCSKEESYKRLQQCDLAFLPLESSFNGQKPLFIPGKLYEYLKFGKPILAMTEESDCKNILVSSGLGLCVAPKEIEGIERIIKELVADKSRVLKKYLPNKDYITNFAFENKTKELAKVFDDLI